MSVSTKILSRPKRRHPLKYTGSRYLAIVDYCSWTGRREGFRVQRATKILADNCKRFASKEKGE